jgi:AAA family ATP:ADP antiporter
MKPGVLDRFLRLFGDVRAREGTRLLLLAANLLLLLFAYYLLKTIREPLVLGVGGGGAEVKSYASAVQAVLLVGVAAAFGWLASRMKRMTLLATVMLFFAANLVAFFLAFMARPGVRLPLGIGFFIWVGCFNVMIVAQFWAFANDLHSKEQGERLFGIIAGGSAIGAVLGAKLAKPLYKLVGPYWIMIIAAGLLLCCLALTWLALRAPDGEAEEKKKTDDADRVGGPNGLTLLLKDRYLLFVALLSPGRSHDPAATSSQHQTQGPALPAFGAGDGGAARRARGLSHHRRQS